MITASVEVVAVLVPANAHALDLGGATSALRVVRNVVPGVHVTILDVGAGMPEERRGAGQGPAPFAVDIDLAGPLLR